MADGVRSAIRSALAQPAMMIGGEEAASASGATLEDLDPATGETIASIPDAGAPDVAAAVSAAREAFPGWSRTPAAARTRILNALADALERDQERISGIETLDNGRPRRETGSQSAIVAKWFRYFAGMTDKYEGRTLPVEGPYLNYTRRVPVGVCAAVTPWNHPMLIATKKIAPALACGNTMVVKPSELAPLSVLELGRLALQAGLPPGVLNVVTGGRSAGEALSTSEGVDRIDVTGSTPTGVAVARAAAGTLKRVGLELGGKAPNVVFADADLERTLRGVAFSAFIAQGQSCVSGSRVLVQEEIASEFARRLAELVATIRVGDPMLADTQLGPVITPASATRVRDHIQGALADGAIALCGGADPPSLSDGLSSDGYVAPTVLAADDAKIRVAREEIFGPVATVTPFRDEDEAVAIANDVPFGLGAGVWTRDVSRAHRVADRIQAGIIWINDYHRNDPASPWGGFKLSGYGRENGWFAVEEYTETKSVWVPLEQQDLAWYDADDGERLN